MRRLLSLFRAHPRVTIAVGLTWLAAWAAIHLSWNPMVGLELWMVVVQLAFLLLVPALIAAGQQLRGDSQLRLGDPYLATAALAVSDVAVLLIPDLVTWLTEGPWWGIVEGAFFFVLLGTVWIFVALVATAVGGSLGWWMAGRRTARTIDSDSTGG